MGEALFRCIEAKERKWGTAEKMAQLKKAYPITQKVWLYNLLMGCYVMPHISCILCESGVCSKMRLKA